MEKVINLFSSQQFSMEIIQVLLIFLFGFIGAFLSSAPPGPINLLCIKQFLEKKNPRDLFYFLTGVILVDTLYALFAFLELSFIDLTPKQNSFFLIFSGIFIFFLAIFLDKTNKKKKVRSPNLLAKSFFSGIILMITNPGFILFWITFIALLPSSSKTFFLIPFFVFGVIIGDITWFYLLKIITFIFQKKIYTYQTKVIFILKLSLYIIAIYQLSRGFYELIT